MLVREQFGKPRMCGLHARRNPGSVEVEPHRQGVDEQAHRPVGAGARMHAAEQHRAEHHLLAAAAPRHHLAPGQMAKARQAHPQPPRLFAQPIVERRRQHPPCLAGSSAIAAHLAQPERQGRLVDIGEHLPEELLMRLGIHAKPRLRHQIAERLRRIKRMHASLENRLDLGMHHFGRRVIADQMMLQLQKQPALAARLARDHEAQQGRLAKIDAMLARIEAALQLLVAETAIFLQLDLAHRQRRLAPHNLRRARQTLPDKGGAQDVMAVDHLLNRRKVAIQQTAIGKGHLRDQQIGIALGCQQMVEQNAVLQRRQAIDILDVADAAGNRRHDPVDLLLGQIDQRQHLWRDRLTLFGDPVGRHRHLVVAAKACGEIAKHRPGEQGAHLDPERLPPQPLHQLHCQQ